MVDVRSMTDAELDAIIDGTVPADEKLGAQPSIEDFGDPDLETASEPTPATTLPELTGGLLTRGAFEAAGGTLGGLVGGGAGALAGGAPTLGAGAAPGATAGVIAGGALGSAAGSALFDNIEDALRFFDVLESPNGQQLGFERAVEIAKTAGLSALEDVVATGTFDVLATGFRAIKPGIGKIIGVRNEAARQFTETARRLGIRLGAADVATGKGAGIPRTFAETLGVFPLVAGPLRGSREKIAEDIGNVVARRLNDLAPNATLAEELGPEIVNAARATRKQFKTVADQLYKNLEDSVAALDVKDIIPTGAILNEAVSQELKRLEGTIALKDGGELSAPLKAQVEKFSKDLLALPERLTFPQFRNLSANLGELFSTLRKNGADDSTLNKLTQLRIALDASLAGIDDVAPELLSESQAKRIIHLRQIAANWYSNGILQFRTPTAKRVQRARKNLLAPGREEAGLINEDEIANVALNLKSPQAIRDLRGLIGDDLFARTGRNFIENAADLAAKTQKNVDAEDVLDMDQFRKLIGLSKSRGGPSRSAVEELVGKDRLKDLDEVTTLAQRVVQSPEVARFLKRRFTLGGLNALKGGLTVGAAVGATGLAAANASMQQVLGIILGTRAFGKLISSPEQLQLLQRAFLTPGVSQTFKRAAAVRLLENIVQPDLEREEELLSLEQPQGA